MVKMTSYSGEKNFFHRNFAVFHHCGFFLRLYICDYKYLWRGTTNQ